MMTTIEAALVYTPEISTLMCFVRYKSALYYCRIGKTLFPENKGKFGRFVGIYENKGDIDIKNIARWY